MEHFIVKTINNCFVRANKMNPLMGGLKILYYTNGETVVVEVACLSLAIVCAQRGWTRVTW